MGSALFISPKRKPRNFDPMIDGKPLAAAEDELNALCAELGVKKLMDFFGMSSRDIENLTGMPVTPRRPAQWFSPTDGLATARALLQYLAANPVKIDRLDHVLADLRDCERVLAHLEEQKIDWHLSVDV